MDFLFPITSERERYERPIERRVYDDIITHVGFIDSSYRSRSGFTDGDSGRLYAPFYLCILRCRSSRIDNAMMKFFRRITRVRVWYDLFAGPCDTMMKGLPGIYRFIFFHLESIRRARRVLSFEDRRVARRQTTADSRETTPATIIIITITTTLQVREKNDIRRHAWDGIRVFFFFYCYTLTLSFFIGTRDRTSVFRKTE